jgi:hypothetical protein
MTDGKEESRPLLHLRTFAQGDMESHAESGVQDWWPSFPQFCNQSAKAFREGRNDRNPEQWRYLYTLQGQQLAQRTDSITITICQHRSQTLPFLLPPVTPV